MFLDKVLRPAILGMAVAAAVTVTPGVSAAGSGQSNGYAAAGTVNRESPAAVRLVNDYPYRSSTPNLVDRWQFYTRQCTSFVAWRLNDRGGIHFDNYWRGVHWGNAYNWDNAARSIGLRVNNQPRVGAVAQWNSGHVAWVTAVHDNGTVTIEEYNYLTQYGYDYRRISASSVENYIHFP